MRDYRYLTTRQCEEEYPVIYHDAEQNDKASKYLVLHEVRARHKNNWQGGTQWQQYRGVITMNARVWHDFRRAHNMIFCKQFPNMRPERTEKYATMSRRPYELCAIYGSPASIDQEIMQARYDVPLALHEKGMSVNAYGVIPPTHRPEYRSEWATIYRGELPERRKHEGLSKHRFAIAFENSNDPYFAYGWVTEKIYDCLGSGTIPIYWGAPNITDYVPADLFVDYRDFSSVSDLHSYLRKTPTRHFTRMSRGGLEFFDSIRFDDYLLVFDAVRDGLPVEPPPAPPIVVRPKEESMFTVLVRHAPPVPPTRDERVQRLIVPRIESPVPPKTPPVPMRIQQEALAQDSFGTENSPSKLQEARTFLAMIIHDAVREEVSLLLEQAQKANNLEHMAQEYAKTPFAKMHPGVRLRYKKWVDAILTMGKNK